MIDDHLGRTARTGDTNGGAGEKYLTFFLGDEEYGIEIQKVQEIIAMMRITRVPRTPPFLRGVVNLRGKVVPVVDLRIKFGMPQIEATEQTCIIVVEAESVITGLVVDRVSEVTAIPPENIEETPPLAADVNTEFLLGIGKTETTVHLLLDIDRVLSAGDVVELHAAAEAVRQ